MRIEGLDELIAKIDNLRQLRRVKSSIQVAALYLRGIAATYPPATAANAPGSSPGDHWYQRGWGSKWVVRDGSVHGRQASENLGKSWTIRTTNGGFRAIVGTDTSYAPWLQDRERPQVIWARSRGWRTVQQIEEDELSNVTEYLVNAITEEIT